MHPAASLVMLAWPMDHISRRTFVSGSAAALLTVRPALAAEAHSAGFSLVARTDRARVLRLAERWLPEAPDTITSHRAPRSPGSPHDFFSEADYFWPNPANPAGPYKERDGESNPDNFLDHRKAMIRLSQAMPALAAGYVLAKREAYGRAAAGHLRAWFADPATRMNPNLELSQGVRQSAITGRSYGIIDTLHLVEVARAAPYVRRFLSAADWTAVTGWFREYLGWMQTSDKGRKERDSTNNHTMAWSLQAAEFARLAGDEATRDALRERLMTVQLPMQMAADGSFPRETARTKPYGYSIFQFDVTSTLAWSLSRPAASGELIRHLLPDGGSMCRAAEFLAPYLADKSAWPFRRDVQHWESWPVRSPGLLFCGLACAKPQHLELWKKLDADPADPEVVRNFPVRQPVLWFD